MIMPAHYLHCENVDQLPDVRPADSSPGLINIWKLDILSQKPQFLQLEQLLNAEEKARAARFHQQKDAQQFTVTRAVLKILLADAASSAPENIKIMLSENNKPLIPENTGVHFNVSHSGDEAVIAIAKQPVGIDVEQMQTDFDYHSVAEYAFSEAESAQVQKSGHPRQEFFRIWTRKEAFLKGLGTGLINDLKLISCLDTPTKINPLIKGVTAGWNIKTLEFDQAYMMSIACESLGPAVRIHLSAYK